MAKKRALPPTYFYITLLLIVILYFVFPIKTIIIFPWNLTGLIPGIAGAVLNIIADKDFKKANTTVKPFDKSSTLITNGVFQISRNPMYLGMVLILISASMITGTISPFFVIPPYIIFMQIVYINEEEKMLEAEFGDDWKNYKTKVRRWI